MAATVAAGFALANPASATVTAATQTPSSATVFTGQTATFTQSYTAVNTDTVVVELSEAVPVTATRTDPFAGLVSTIGSTGIGAAVEAKSWNAAGNVAYDDITISVTATNPTVKLAVGTSVAGNVSIVGGADGGATTGRTDNTGALLATQPHVPSSTVRTPTSTLTAVARSASGPDFDVTKLAASPTSLAGYTTESPYTFTVTATGSNGLPVDGATVLFQVTSAGNTTQTYTATGTTAADGTLSVPVTAAELNSVGGSAASDSIVFFVNNATTGSITSGLDSGDTQTAPVAARVDTAPTYTGMTLTSPNDATDLQQGVAGSTTYTVGVNNGASGVSGVKVGLDVQPTGVTTPTRYTGTTGADGTVTITVPVAAADAHGNLNATAYVSEQNTVGAGDQVHKATDNNVGFSVPAPALGAPSTLQATPGSTVNVPVTVSDQFGNAAGNGDTLSYTVSGRNTASGTVTVAGGKATVSYPDKGTGTSGTDTVSVTDLTHAYGTTSTTVSYVASLAPSKVTLSHVPASGANGAVSSTYQDYTVATVTNAAGEPLVNSPVTFSTNLGYICDDSAPTTCTVKTGASSVTVNTDSSGNATLDYGSTKTGAQTVTATDGSASAAWTNAFTYTAGVKASVTLTGPSTVASGGSAAYTATIADQFGNAVPGTGDSITFSATDPSVLPGGVSPLSTPAPTGQVTVTIKAGSADGTITATDASIAAPNNTASVKYTVSNVHFIAVDGANGAKPGTPEKVAVHVYPEAATTVTVTVSGANSATGTVTTDATGRGSFYYTPTAVGVDKAVASVGSVSNTTTIYVSETHFIAIAGASGATRGHTERVAVHVYPAAVVAVEVHISGANSAAGTVITDASGRANFYYTPRSGGVDKATANVGGVSNTATINVTGVRFIAVAGAYGAQTGHTERVAVHVYPAQSTAVVVHVSGSNFASGTVRTNASGIGNFYYTPRKAGTDKAVVSASGVNNVATIRVR